MITQWTCDCGEINSDRSRFCTSCGSERVRAEERPREGVPRHEPQTSTQVLLKQPLCEHSTIAGVMCDACQAVVTELRKQFRAFGDAIGRRNVRWPA